MHGALFKIKLLHIIVIHKRFEISLLRIKENIYLFFLILNRFDGNLIHF